MSTDAKSPPSPPNAVAAATTTTATTTTGTNEDVVLLGPPTADGAGVHVLRAREQRIEAGELRNIEEGRPITGELVTLSPRKDNPRICDVKESYRPPASGAALSAAKKGPAQVATQEYRDHWDEVFADRPPNKSLN